MSLPFSSVRPVAALIAALVACLGLPAAAAAQAADTYTLVARLGTDTVAIERVTLRPDGAEADVLIRSPRTLRLRQTASYGADGALLRFESVTTDPASGAEVRRTRWTRDGDSLRVTDAQESRETMRAVAAPGAVLPFIDLVHWPFDVALRRLAASGAASVGAPMLAGARVSGFPLARIGRDSATVTHPTRGTMRVQVRADGALLALDAAATTRKLLVTRTEGGDLSALAAAWVAADRAGRGVGALSGRATTTVTVRGATLTFDHGTPQQRGRAIWGALVKYGEVWRTGANEATHVTTDRTLRLGTLEVPPGRYTLYSIPAADGGLLIVNRQTGQNGQQYDAARDLGRVPMTARPLGVPVETFTITAVEENGRGLLRLMWGDAERVVPFDVVP